MFSLDKNGVPSKFKKETNTIDLIQNENDAKKYNTNQKKISYVTQTTLSVDDTKDIIKILKDKFPNIKEPAKEDIYSPDSFQYSV